MFKLNCEYTDTFGGQANYCWVDRVTLELPDNLSDLAIVRRAKAALGLNGVKGQMFSHGDMWEFRPHNSCTVAFFTVDY